MAASVTRKIHEKVAAAVGGKAYTKKKTPSATKKKTAKPPSDKVIGKPSGGTNKAGKGNKQVKKILPAAKPVTKKPFKKEKPQEKTVTTNNRLTDLKKSLIRKKEHILKEAKVEIAKYISGDNKQLVDTANDDGDWAQVDISEDISLQRLSAHRKLMYNIDEAIRKIADGTYGVCEECGEEISEKRLLVLPTATLCVDCQENKEQLEALESEE